MACETQIKANEDRISKGFPLLLHSPFGWSLRHFYEAAGLSYDARGEIFQEHHRIAKHKSPEFAISYSMKTHPHLMTTSLIPTIDEEIIERWFDLENGQTTLAVVKGWKIFADFPLLLESLTIQRRLIDPFDNLPPRIDSTGKTLSWSEDSRRICRVSSKCPATMKAVKYEPSCIFLIECNNEVPIVLKIMDSACNCRAGDSKHCPHVAALLFTIQNGRKDFEPEKSKAWKIPRSRNTVDCSVPICQMAFVKQDLKKAKSQPPTKRQRTSNYSMHLTEQEGRGAWVQWTSYFKQTLDASELEFHRQKFFELVRHRCH